MITYIEHFLLLDEFLVHCHALILNLLDHSNQPLDSFILLVELVGT